MQAILSFALRSVQKYWMLIFFCSFFFLLLVKNPYSTRNLIGNLEPYPDSFHYVDPAMNVVKGKGIVIEREGRAFAPSVPPLYSLVLAPVYLFSNDVRSFYVINVMLAILSVVVLYRLLTIHIPSRTIQFFVLFLYVASYPLRWFPELAMAENLILLLFLYGLLLLSLPARRTYAAIAGAVAISFYATKYASLPLSAWFACLYTLHILLLKKKLRSRELLWFFGSLFLWGSIFLVYEYLAKGTNVLLSLASLFVSVYVPKSLSGGAEGGGGFFGTSFIQKNVSAYGGWILGEPMMMLWKKVQIVPQLIALLSFAALLGGVMKKKFSFVCLALLSSYLFVIGFLMVFYAYDGRYFITAIPSVILGIGIFLQVTRNFLVRRIGRVWVLLFMFCLIGGTILYYAKPLKLSLALNLKYAENPWYVIAAEELERVIEADNDKNPPIVISAMAPYFLDYYVSPPFEALPLHSEQEFRSRKVEAWGNHDYSNLVNEYRRALDEGKTVYLMQYGLGNEQYLHDAFNEVQKEFVTTKVFGGCYDLCNIYQLR